MDGQGGIIKRQQGVGLPTDRTTSSSSTSSSSLLCWVSISLRVRVSNSEKTDKPMDADAGDFPDWEVLSDPEDSGDINSSDSSENMPGLDGFERDIIRFDYFSLEQHDDYGRPIASDDGSSSVESDNPSWIDPGTGTEAEIHYARKDCWTDSSSERSDDRKVGDFGGNSELGIAENAKLDVGVEVGAESEESLGSLAIDDKGYDAKDELVFSGEEKVVDELKGGNEDVAVGAVKSCGDEGKSGGNGMVWWKLPLDILKYCLLRASPVWTVSVAAAMMGLVILGRRLYKMKRKSRSLQLKVTVDDKKVSQFMSRAARLNEAFSVVKRVPVIRPSLPATSVTPWPMMSLR